MSSNIKIIKVSGNEKKRKEKKIISVKVGRRTPAHHDARNQSIVKAYRAGYPQKRIATKAGLSVRQVSNIINKVCSNNKERQKWYDEHEFNAVKYRSGRQESQSRFKPFSNK